MRKVKRMERESEKYVKGLEDAGERWDGLMGSGRRG